ncbi:MAG: hypothetical protein LH479_09130 [Polaromonas sp.]|nr:hypothetical protein [Polaromonas sp.]
MPEKAAGGCVVSFGFGHGHIVAFQDYAKRFPPPVIRHYSYGSEKKVLAVLVDFIECGLACI